MTADPWHGMTPPERWAFAACTARQCARAARRAGQRDEATTWERDRRHWEGMVRGFADALIATWQSP